jgi:hypothetical protein
LPGSSEFSAAKAASRRNKFDQIACFSTIPAFPTLQKSFLPQRGASQ